MVISASSGSRVTSETNGLEHTRRGCVLLVEDDDAMRKLLAFVLTRRGFRVVTAHDGAHALAYLATGVLTGNPNRLPRLLVTDQRMPGVCGLDVMEAVQTAGMRIPTILITAFGDREIYDRAHALAAAAVLDKPFAIAEFLAIVERIRPRCMTPSIN